MSECSNDQPQSIEEKVMTVRSAVDLNTAGENIADIANFAIENTNSGMLRPSLPRCARRPTVRYRDCITNHGTRPPRF